MDIVILGSGPNAPDAARWDRAHFDKLVAINNAWRIREDWDFSIYPEDFPEDRRVDQVRPGQNLVEADAFVPAQNAYGGFLYGGATMAFTAAYWALYALRPRRIGLFGCDMVYGSGKTHFYGKGTADPLRADASLRSLEAKCARLMVHAALQGCAIVNLSDAPSRLVAPRVNIRDLRAAEPLPFQEIPAQWADAEEHRLNYTTPEGWHTHLAGTMDLAAMDRIDDAWRTAVKVDQPLQKAS